MDLGPPLLFLGGPGPLLLNLEFCLNMNTSSIGSILKVNRLMKKMLQNFGSILPILFVIYCL